MTPRLLAPLLALIASGCAGYESWERPPDPTPAAQLIAKPLEEKNWAACVEILTEAFRKERHIPYLLERCRIYTLWGNYEKAFEEYLKLAMDYPDNYKQHDLWEQLMFLGGAWLKELEES